MLAENFYVPSIELSFVTTPLALYLPVLPSDLVIIGLAMFSDVNAD